MLQQLYMHCGGELLDRELFIDLHVFIAALGGFLERPSVVDIPRLSAGHRECV